MRTAIYARKSTESDDRQIQSLDDQLTALTTLAEREGLNVSEVFLESKSAKEPYTRPEFQRLITKIQEGSIDGVLTWNIDRLSRNLVDGGIIAHLLQTGRLSFIRTTMRTYRPEDNAILLSIENGMATTYLQDLSRNVKRGLKGKIERGWLPARAPVGYRNNLITHEIEPDPERFELIRHGWDLLINERLTPSEILRRLVDLGLTTTTKRGTNPSISNSLLYTVFRNPFYMGKFRYNGQLLQGRQQPMIEDWEFQIAQERLQKCPDRKGKNRDHIYAGIFRCGICGCGIVGEIKEKRVRGSARTYMYYHCSGVRGCPRTSCTQEDIEDAIEAAIQKLPLPRSIEGWAERSIRGSSAEETESDEAIVSLKRQLATEEGRLKTAHRMRLDGELESSEYGTLKADLIQSIEELKGRLGLRSTLERRVDEMITNAMSVSHLAPEFRLLAKDSKRTFVQRLGSNHTITKGSIKIDLDPLLKALSEFEPPELGSGGSDSDSTDDQNSIWLDFVDYLRKIARMQLLHEEQEKLGALTSGGYVPPERGRPYKRNRVDDGRHRALEDVLEFERRRSGAGLDR